MSGPPTCEQSLVVLWLSEMASLELFIPGQVSSASYSVEVAVPGRVRFAHACHGGSCSRAIVVAVFILRASQ